MLIRSNYLEPRVFVRFCRRYALTSLIFAFSAHALAGQESGSEATEVTEVTQAIMEVAPPAAVLVVDDFSDQVSAFSEEVPLTTMIELAGAATSEISPDDDVAMADDADSESEVSKPVAAPNVKLKDVAPVLIPAQMSEVKPGPLLIAPQSGDSCLAPEIAALPEIKFSPDANHMLILGADVAPGTATRLAWMPGVSISGLEVPTPILVVNGAEPGPTLCLTAAIHGDEINGIEITRRVIYDIDPTKLVGKVIGVPIVNLQGFQRGSRYLPDRRDLNRFFPGSEKGSLASRVAHSLFSEVISHCDMLVDFHTGSARRSNLPQVRADMQNPAVARFTEGFDDMVVVHSPGAPGMLRNAAAASGIPAVTLEVGESLRLQADQVTMGAKSIQSLMEREGMYSRSFSWGDPEPVYYKSRWMRANRGGILLNDVKLGTVVKKGTLLGTVTDPITNESTDIISPVNGRVIGMAVNQVVMHGYAAYHIGIEASEKAVVESAHEESSGVVDPEIDYINEEMEPED